jgi:hypothetical protein
MTKRLGFLLLEMAVRSFKDGVEQRCQTGAMDLSRRHSRGLTWPWTWTWRRRLHCLTY